VVHAIMNHTRDHLRLLRHYARRARSTHAHTHQVPRRTLAVHNPSPARSCHSGSTDHSHHDDGCWFKVIEEQSSTAKLTETRRDPAGRISVSTATPATGAAFMHNRHGSHIVWNHTPAWVHSLHLYPN
jgi:hypothetical protein